MSDSEKTTKKRLKLSSKKKDKNKNRKKIRTKIEREHFKKGSNSLNLSIKNKDNIDDCLAYLELFLKELDTTDLDDIITEKNIEKFQKISEIENIQVDLFMTKIYNKILSSEKFYTDYFSEHDENDIKIELVLMIIEEAIKIIENLEDIVISKDNFDLKGNLINFIRFMKINLKEDMKDEDIKQLEFYLNELPINFYSQNYL